MIGSEYDAGYGDGYSQGRDDEANNCDWPEAVPEPGGPRLPEPVALINQIEYLDRQDWFDRLKLEAIRLGVSP